MSTGQEKLWTCIARCGVCKKQIGLAEHVPDSRQTMVMMSASLNCLCDVREHNTYSDCNIGVELEWVEEVAPVEA
jgi:hypothetical protein